MTIGEGFDESPGRGRDGPLPSTSRPPGRQAGRIIQQIMSNKSVAEPNNTNTTSRQLRASDLTTDALSPTVFDGFDVRDSRHGPNTNQTTARQTQVAFTIPKQDDSALVQPLSTAQLARERSRAHKHANMNNDAQGHGNSDTSSSSNSSINDGSAKKYKRGTQMKLQRSKRGRSLFRPERQPAPQPGDPHYHTYMRQGLDITAPAGPNSKTRKRNILTRADSVVMASLANSGGHFNSLQSYHPVVAQKQKAGLVGRVMCSISQKTSKLPSPWTAYTRFITFWAPGPILALCGGMRDKKMQTAWREKIALVSLILVVMAIIGFLTFGLQQVLCNGLSGQQQRDRVKFNEIDGTEAVVNGQAYNLTHFKHPATEMTGDDGDLLNGRISAGYMDLSLLFQNPNGYCKGVLRYDDSDGTSFVSRNGNVVSAFPCRMVETDTARNKDFDPSESFDPALCHNSLSQRNRLDRLPKRQVYYEWKDVESMHKNMVVYNGAVLDLKRLDWLLPQVQLPAKIVSLRKGTKYHGRDLTMYFASSNTEKAMARCLVDLVKVGTISSITPGCMISNIILYVSLIVILGAVFAKFFMAVYFGWFMSRSLGAPVSKSPKERKQRLERIEAWADQNNHNSGRAREVIDLRYSVAPAYLATTAAAGSGGGGRDPSFSSAKKLPWLPTVSRYSQFNPGDEPAERRTPRRGRSGTNMLSVASSSGNISSIYISENQYAGGDSSFAGTLSNGGVGNGSNPDIEGEGSLTAVTQSEYASYPVGEMPTSSQVISGPLNLTHPTFGFPLAYTLLLVTCYSEGAEGIRTTLDSLAGTDYPSFHKCIFVICDGLIKGEGEDMYTPDVCLSMMKDFVIPPDRVQPYTYVAIASGAKRRNMAKIYAGYYAPGENSPQEAKRERVPMVLVVKCGSPEEANEKKPGNRGKRDSQVLLMRFLQHVMFDERMTELEYELFNALWNVTKVTPDNFEICLMVDADTKIYSDSVTYMVSAMVKDPQVMGLCGETKIANKRDSWVSAIQVFEYYISHHLAKAFESVFGGVTCLPGCFCMYRIKAPKGTNNYWVPILSNPNIVENYSEHVVDTLHKKNLLLLGEDRYLSTLMLRTFPKRKMVFVPSAVCKTVVPDKFKVLLSQRRRWINSTVHNLMELVLVKDLCGTFCLSMQFVIFMELIGTIALPAAIAFTLYIVIISTFTRPVPYLPLALLACILFLPAILIGLTTRKLVYVGWMFIYLFALPIWNFVLPVYAYWHFDDFSWGETRKVTGEGKDTGHDADEDSEFDSSKIVMKRWGDFEAEKRYKARAIFNKAPELRDFAMEFSSSNSDTPVGSTRNNSTTEFPIQSQPSSRPGAGGGGGGGGGGVVNVVHKELNLVRGLGQIDASSTDSRSVPDASSSSSTSDSGRASTSRNNSSSSSSSNNKNGNSNHRGLAIQTSNSSGGPARSQKRRNKRRSASNPTHCNPTLLAMLQKAAAAADLAMTGDENGRLSVATDDLERLGYMTPNMIPSLAVVGQRNGVNSSANGSSPLLLRRPASTVNLAHYRSPYPSTSINNSGRNIPRQKPY